MTIHAEPQMLGILAQTTVRVADPSLAREQAFDAETRIDALEGQMRWALLLSLPTCSCISARATT